MMYNILHNAQVYNCKHVHVYVWSSNSKRDDGGNNLRCFAFIQTQQLYVWLLSLRDKRLRNMHQTSEEHASNVHASCTDFCDDRY